MSGSKTEKTPSILVVQNFSDAPPGLLGERIARRGWRMDLRQPMDSDASSGFGLPQGVDHDALIILGGTQDAWDDERYPAMAAVIALIRRYLEADAPILGVCLGGQLLARALGASIRRMDNGYERGLVAMSFPADAPPSILHHRPVRLASWHQDYFDIPQGARLLMSSDACSNQAFLYGDKVYGFQCHVEATPSILKKWLDGSAETDPVAAQKTRSRIESEMDAYFDKVTDDASFIIESWLDITSVDVFSQ